LEARRRRSRRIALALVLAFLASLVPASLLLRKAWLKRQPRSLALDNLAPFKVRVGRGVVAVFADGAVDLGNLRPSTFQGDKRNFSRVWLYSPDGELLGTLDDPETLAILEDVAVSPSGEWIATQTGGAREGPKGVLTFLRKETRVWRTKTRERLWSQRAEGRLSFSPESDRLLSAESAAELDGNPTDRSVASGSSGLYALWSVPQGELLKKGRDLAFPDGFTSGGVVRSGGASVAALDSGDVTVYSLREDKVLSRWTPGPVLGSFAFSEPGRLFASNLGGSILLSRVSDGLPLRLIDIPGENPVTSVAFSSDEETLAYVLTRREIHAVNVATGRSLTVLGEKEKGGDSGANEIESIAFLPDEDLIVANRGNRIDFCPVRR
jgi:WD40 repeat protein